MTVTIKPLTPVFAGEVGAIEGWGGAGVDGQEKIYALDVGVARGGDGGGEREAVAVRQHQSFSTPARAQSSSSWAVPPPTPQASTRTSWRKIGTAPWP